MHRHNSKRMGLLCEWFGLDTWAFAAGPATLLWIWPSTHVYLVLYDALWSRFYQDHLPVPLLACLHLCWWIDREHSPSSRIRQSLHGQKWLHDPKQTSAHDLGAWHWTATSSTASKWIDLHWMQRYGWVWCHAGLQSEGCTLLRTASTKICNDDAPFQLPSPVVSCPNSLAASHWLELSEGFWPRWSHLSRLLALKPSFEICLERWRRDIDSAIVEGVGDLEGVLPSGGQYSPLSLSSDDMSLQRQFLVSNPLKMKFLRPEASVKQNLAEDKHVRSTRKTSKFWNVQYFFLLHPILLGSVRPSERLLSEPMRRTIPTVRLAASSAVHRPYGA